MKKKTINKVMILVVAGIAVFLSALTVASMTMEKPKTASQVETVEVEKGNVAEELDATGTVESRNKKVFFSGRFGEGKSESASECEIRPPGSGRRRQSV